MPTKGEIEIFEQKIYDIISTKKTNYIDAILLYCNENNINVVDIKSLIGKKLKARVKKEAKKLNMLKIPKKRKRRK